MRTLLLLTLLAGTTVHAQDSLPPAATEQSPGMLITQGARQKNAGLIVGLVGAGLGVMLSSDSREGSADVGAGVAIAFGMAGVVLNISGNSKQAKAGKLLRERGY